MPLRTVQGLDVLEDDFVLEKPVHFTPTFVVIENRREVGRITGYHGDAAFWEMLDYILLTLSSPTVGN
ncbi:MAG: regulatory protein SoxS [Rhodospirillaceae bacterium]|nr:MAG: regulatory protein SoxS [Rhodospirillaceae bacterium]